MDRDPSAEGRGPPGSWIRPRSHGDMGTIPPDGGNDERVRQTRSVPIQTARQFSRTSCLRDLLFEAGTLMRDTGVPLVVIEGPRHGELLPWTIWAESEKTFPSFVLRLSSLFFHPLGSAQALLLHFHGGAKVAAHPSRTCNPSRCS